MVLAHSKEFNLSEDLKITRDIEISGAGHSLGARVCIDGAGVCVTLRDISCIGLDVWNRLSLTATNVRAINSEGDGLDVMDYGSAMVDGGGITGSAIDGVRVGRGSSVSLARLEIKNNKRGISAWRGGKVILRDECTVNTNFEDYHIETAGTIERGGQVFTVAWNGILNVQESDEEAMQWFWAGDNGAEPYGDVVSQQLEEARTNQQATMRSPQSTTWTSG